MKCSVIIPAFKQAEYLGAAIESVLQQKGWDWAEMLALDGSLPESLTGCNGAQLRQATRALGQELRRLKGDAK